MSAKPDTPITRKEMYLDVMTGGSAALPEPVTIEEKFLAKIAGMTVDLPAPVPLKHKFLAKIAGMQVDVPTYTAGLPRIYAYLAKAAGQDVEVPQPITREEMYWFDYVGEQPTPSEQEYTGAVPVTFIANGKSLLDYLISGNSVQNGTSTPDSPVMPQGTGERTGNLFDKDRTQGIITDIYINQSGEQISSQNYYLSYPIEVLENSVYTWSFATGTSAMHSAPTVAFYDINDELLGVATHKSSIKHFTFTTPSNTKYIRGSVYKGQNQNTTMFLEGDTQIVDFESMDYIPFGYKIPISSASTTTLVYLGEVQTTRKVKKLVLTGEENFSVPGTYPGGYLYLFLPSVIAGDNGAMAISTHYKQAYNNNGQNVYIQNHRIVIIDATHSTTADFKSYLAAQYASGTPVTVWYVLATEETGIVNEPLMKIGDYADTLSMEQAGVQISTVNGSNTLDVLTTVKPSEVYIKYKGEPVPQLSMLSSPNINVPEEPSEETEEIPEEVPEEKEEETESITPETTKE